jgi:hypothetical protein
MTGRTLAANPSAGRELGPIALLAALDFHELGYQRPTTAVEVHLDGLALRFEAKARFALLIRRNPVVREPQSMSGAFWGSRTALWSDSIPKPTRRIQCSAEGGWFSNLLICNVEMENKIKN